MHVCMFQDSQGIACPFLEKSIGNGCTPSAAESYLTGWKAGSSEKAANWICQREKDANTTKYCF
jgi:hypothetical protein